MKSFLKNRNLLLWAIAILLIANLSAMVTVHINLRKQKVPVMGLPQETAPGQFKGQKQLHKQLNLSKNQYKAYKTLRINHRQETLLLHEEMNALRADIARELAQENPNKENLTILAESFGRIQSELKEKAFLHFTEIKGICNQDQKRIFNTKIMDVVDGRKPGPGLRQGRQHDRLNKFQN
jgi:hypothetical protein